MHWVAVEHCHMVASEVVELHIEAQAVDLLLEHCHKLDLLEAHIAVANMEHLAEVQ